MNLFMSYLAGACLAGFIFAICFNYIKSFYTFLFNSINDAKKDLKNKNELSDDNRILLDYIDNNTVITAMLVFITILSWVGVIIDIIYILAWLLDEPKNE